jgi:hypothetical protein
MKLLVLLSLVVAAAQAIHYKLELVTSNDVDAGSNSQFYLAALNFDGDLIDFGHINDEGKVFMRGDHGEAVFDEDDLGELACIIIQASSDYSDAWLIHSFHFSSDSDPTGFGGSNLQKLWLSGDPSGDGGHIALMACKGNTGAMISLP